MFLKKKKVTKELFGQIMKKGAVFAGSFFVFRVFVNLNLPQYAFVVPKSMAKKAVIRNKLRRRGYSALRAFSVKNSQGIFFYKKNDIEIPFDKLKNDIDFLLKKSMVIKK
jgi:ribonuclease P protein component